MKKLLMMFAFSAIILGTVIAEPKNKIGADIGWPIAFNYSRQVSDLVEIDILAGLDSIVIYNSKGYTYELNGVRGTAPFTADGFGFAARVTPLFKVWSGPVGTVTGKFSLGPGLGFTIGSVIYTLSTAATFNASTTSYGIPSALAGGFNISLPLRFEFQFKVPFNLYLELSPVGIAVNMCKPEYYDKVIAGARYYARGGLGLRYSF
ncbi:MAG: hypothetical protein P1P63_04095 [Treponemataceae bacterium]